MHVGMINLHIKAEACAVGFKPIVEACNDGKQIYKETGPAFLSEAKALAYAEKVGASFLKDKASSYGLNV